MIKIILKTSFTQNICTILKKEKKGNDTNKKRFYLHFPRNATVARTSIAIMAIILKDS